LRDRISALELKLAELTGAIDILRGTTPPPARDTRALGELLSPNTESLVIIHSPASNFAPCSARARQPIGPAATAADPGTLVSTA
jgi:hypothetical protein